MAYTVIAHICIYISVLIRHVSHLFSSIQDDTVVHEFATLCLVPLSQDYVCKVQIFDNKGLPPLIQLLSSPDPDVQKNSLEIIFNLIQVTQNHQSLGRSFLCHTRS